MTLQELIDWAEANDVDKASELVLFPVEPIFTADNSNMGILLNSDWEDE